jgi:hypothetical protein
MTIEQLRSLCAARPFRAFIMHLADGRALRVDHPEFIITAPSGRTAVVYQRDDSFNVVDLLLVTDLEVSANGTGPKGKRRKT